MNAYLTWGAFLFVVSVLFIGIFYALLILYNKFALWRLNKKYDEKQNLSRREGPGREESNFSDFGGAESGTGELENTELPEGRGSIQDAYAPEHEPDSESTPRPKKSLGNFFRRRKAKKEGNE